MASGGAHHVTASGSALVEREMSNELRGTGEGTARPAATASSAAQEEEIISDTLPAGTLPTVIGSYPSTSPKITNIADQASRLT